MASQAPAKTTLFYLYVGSEWSGPFQVEQIRFFRRHGQVESDTYAYDPDQQRHYTVGELLSAVAEPPAGEASRGGDVAHPLVPPELDEASTPSTTRIFLSSEHDEAEATATLGTSLDALPDPLASFYRTFRTLTEGRPADREQVVAHLVETGSAIGIQLSAAVNDPASLTLLVGDLLRLADYLANRHQDAGLWEAIDMLRAHRPEVDPEEAISAGRLVVGCLVDRAKRGPAGHEIAGLLPATPEAAAGRPDVTPDLTESQEIKAVTDSWDQPHARTARAILRDARKELRSTEADLGAIQKAYAELQELHTRDLDEAREMLARLESERADESANAAQALAEVRSLAAEIHRLAEEHLSGEQDLKNEIIRLAEELKGSDATAMAPLAEAMLIRLVTRLRNLARAPGQDQADVTLLREELASARSELVQARAQVLVLTDERDRLKRQLDEQRAAADRAITNAKEREQRLRSTVTALEVTKDLHQDVMRELEVQLTGAQRRVSEMEGELSTVRVELNKTRIHLTDRTKELQDEMRRAVELRALLEARREELSVNLKDAEAQLVQAQSDQATQAEGHDPELMEALAVKVNHLRTMFEATKRRLDEQQGVAAKLEEELGASRREASELRGRSDSLNNELDDARTGLAAAKKRFEELNRAYSRLENEREALQHELLTRKGTDTLHKSTETLHQPSDSPRKGTDAVARSTEGPAATTRLGRVVEQLEAKVAETTRKLQQADDQLESERQRVQELTLAHDQLQVRVEDLTADRDQVRSELDRLHAESFSEHSRHAAALAVSTQSAIEAERRLKQTVARMVELEEQVAYLQANQQPMDAALSQLSVDGDEVEGVAPGRLEELQRQLDQARAEIAKLSSASAAAETAQQERLTERLVRADANLSAATAARDDASSQLRGAIAERDRLGRELARLKNEHESAAVEHRASLKSARDKLIEAQARIQVLERDLESARQGDPKVAEHAVALAAERDRLSEEVRGLRAQLERVDTSGELASARRQLEQELDRIKALTRSLGETQQQADAARTRVASLEAKAGSAQHERDQLQIEIERLKGELLMAQASAGASRETDVGRRQQLESKLREVMGDREQLLSELSRVNAELMTVRGRLVRAESESVVTERLPAEQDRVRELESLLQRSRGEAQAAGEQLAELRAQLAAVTAERDELRRELSELRQKSGRSGTDADMVKELVNLRDKLTRAKMRIRELRRERDGLLRAANGESHPAEGGSTTLIRSAAAAVTTSRIGVGAHTESGTFVRVSTGANQPTALLPAMPIKPIEPVAPGDVSAAAHPAVGSGSPLERNDRDSGPQPFQTGSQSRVEGRPATPGFTSQMNRPRLPPVTAAQPRQTQRLLATKAIVRDAPSSPWMVPTLLAVAGATILLGGSTMLVYSAPAHTVRAWVNAQSVPVLAPIDGRQSGATVEVRSAVKHGEPLFTMTNPDPEHGDLDRLKDVIEESDARLSALRNERDGILSRPAQTGVATFVQPFLGPLRPVADPAVERTAREVAALDRQINDELAAVATARTQLVAAQRALDARRTAQVMAPCDGVVLRRIASSSRWLRTGDPVLEVADQGSIAIEATFSSAMAKRIAVGTQVEVSLGDEKRIIPATISEILTSDAPAADQSLRAVDTGVIPSGGIRTRIAIPADIAATIAVGQPARVLVTGPDASLTESIGVALRRKFWL
jgi:chromosome segregation ATPase/multidrug resistance efflux pump